MGSKQTIDKDTDSLIKKLIKLRDISKNDRTKCGEEILKSLNYKKQRKNYQFDAFLIKAIDWRFGESMDADIVLMAFGLLQGYEYDKIAITNRRYKYLEESNYLEYNPRSKIKSFVGVDDREKKKLVEGLRKKEDKRIEWLADFLLDQSGIEKFIDEVDDYIEIIDGKSFAKLPEPSYLLQDNIAQNEAADIGQKKGGRQNPAAGHVPASENHGTDRTNAFVTAKDILLAEVGDIPHEQKADAAIREIPEKVLVEPPAPTQTPARIPWRLKLPAMLTIVACIVLSSALSILIYNYSVMPPGIKEIAVKTDILVSPGGKEDLELEVFPAEASIDGLHSKVDNENLVAVTDDWWAVGLDGLGDKDRDDTVIVIWGGEAEPAIVNVIVEKPGSRGK